ncbi:hypothetical protein SDC9_209919 [bioreactor metagenome]|uniref:Uncharacterized protein n=1 Tax=bioreactor metagenome TaxID=1076179 RepID=A0A645JG35_9ZZZZ
MQSGIGFIRLESLGPLEAMFFMIKDIIAMVGGTSKQPLQAMNTSIKYGEDTTVQQ